MSQRRGSSDRNHADGRINGDGGVAVVMDVPHRRRNALTGEWVLVSSGRTSRPWQGSTEAPAAVGRPQYDPGCYLCPGNTRATGDRNPDYDETFVFTNDFAALQPDVGHETVDDGLLQAESEPGTCRVICYSPRHDLDLASMDTAGIRTVVDLWSDQVADLAKEHTWVQVFENRGATMGASNPHPHGQVWAGVCYWRLIACRCSCFKTHFVGITTLKTFSTECSYYKMIRFSFIQIINSARGICGFPVWVGVII